ncbi:MULTISPECIES: anti-sigma B factor RsbW [unclassified Paenibacillus]|uniref:anti-sigma B factor RsbW n=1 Tax=unclassified Paenibacillus TaxID=185978 RepID=UPI000954A992|nr:MULTISPECIES: anti-sigma B factor RsbW [unclassified Paenibacillus]ASS66778.1 anti-sigma B factor RsbW [Paenibacillus sp. RUD330]SIP95739.1 serine/threonine-protein kinase RsbW [Paenibacillus sp. RU4X]SIQ14239.1 serine/threonine-protein kinase RsbW [Paenibacillus sp. RU4T]
MNPAEERIVLRLPARSEYLDLIRLTLYGVATKVGFTYEEIEDMKVAVSEACNNAVLYAYAGHADSDGVGEMEIRFVRTPDALSIIVKDEGASFDAASVAQKAEPLHGKSIHDIQAGGLGLYLMQALMDEVEVRSEIGTEVVLTKRLVKSGELA